MRGKSKNYNNKILCHQPTYNVITLKAHVLKLMNAFWGREGGKPLIYQNNCENILCFPLFDRVKLLGMITAECEN